MTDTLSELVEARREELGLSFAALAAASGGLVSKSHAAAIEAGDLHVPSERVLRGLALALDLPVDRVFTAAGRQYQKQDLGRFTLPEKADRLNARERKLVLSLIETLLAAHDRP